MMLYTDTHSLIAIPYRCLYLATNASRAYYLLKENKHTGAQTLHPLFKQFNKGRRGQTVIRREECDPWASPVDCEERYRVKKKERKEDGWPDPLRLIVSNRAG